MGDRGMTLFEFESESNVVFKSAFATLEKKTSILVPSNIARQVDGEEQKQAMHGWAHLNKIWHVLIIQLMKSSALG